MKKLIFLLVILFCVKMADAQSFSLGAKLGYNANKLSSDLDTIKAGVKNTMQIGAYARLGLGEKAYLQPEVNYQVTKGEISNINPVLTARNYTLNCIKVPVLVGVKLVKLGVANVRVMGGPAFTYMMGKKLDETSSSQLWPIKTKDDLKNSAWSAQVGAGVDILFLTLDVRYEFGITNLYKGDSDLKMKNNMFNVSLGVKLL